VKRLVYVLRFHRPAGEGAPTTAGGLRVTTTLEGRTFATDMDTLTGDGATLELEYAVNRGDATQFFEWGTVSFGESPGDSSLTFASTGVGTLAAQPDPDGFSHGAVSYVIQGGTGALEGARGMITSNFIVNLNTNELFDTHVGIVLVQGS
jgi:hypothetical protein